MGELRDKITLIAVSSFGEGSRRVFPPHTRRELFFFARHEPHRYDSSSLCPNASHCISSFEDAGGLLCPRPVADARRRPLQHRRRSGGTSRCQTSPSLI